MSKYTIVKYALMIILAVGLLGVILNLVPELQRGNNTNLVVTYIIQLVILVIGFLGSYRDNRQMLLTFAIILTVIIVVAVAQSQAASVLGNAVLEIILIVLAVYQSELIRSSIF